jgi:hypothetical protein
MNPTQGSLLKSTGIARVSAATSPEWMDAAMAWITWLAQRGPPFTSENIIEEIGQPTDIHGNPKPNAMGAVFCAAARRGLIVRTGYQQATRASRHAGMISVWRGKV